MIDKVFEQPRSAETYIGALVMELYKRGSTDFRIHITLEDEDIIIETTLAGKRVGGAMRMKDIVYRDNIRTIAFYKAEDMENYAREARGQ
jgi:hypothetical protein